MTKPGSVYEGKEKEKNRIVDGRFKVVKLTWYYPTKVEVENW